MNIQRLRWSEARSILRKVNSELTDIVDNIDETHHLPLYLLEYEYGDIIASPDQNFLHPTKPYGDVFGKFIPFSIVIDKKFEMFVEIGEKSFCYRVYEKGMVFKTARFLEDYENNEPKDIIKISAGARNTFLLPKVSETLPHREMCAHFNTIFTQPRSLEDHHLVFKEIAGAAKSSWKAKLLCFSPEWYTQMLERKPLHLYALMKRYNNRFDSYLRSVPLYEILLSYIRSMEEQNNINTFTYEIFKHLYAIGCGVTPGFSPVINDDFLPYECIAKVYRDIYKIKTIPFAMEPSYFQKNSDPIYYSLLRSGPITKPKALPNALKFSIETAMMFKRFNKIIHKHDMYKGTNFRECAERAMLTVFNDRAQPGSNILNTQSDLFMYDNRFNLAAKIAGMQNERYTTTSAFFTGCFGLRY